MTRLVRISPQTIGEAAALVIKGELVVYPTDTVYGLGCDPFNNEAVKKLVLAKERKHGRLPILVASMGEAEQIGRFDSLARNLARSFWPGPLTLVVPLARSLPDSISDSTGTVGLRIPAREDTISLIRACGGPIVGTSANISGRVSPKSAAEAMTQLEGRVELVLDGGPSLGGVESCVVRVESGQVSILRAGAIGIEPILAMVQKSRSTFGMLKRSC